MLPTKSEWQLSQFIPQRFLTRCLFFSVVSGIRFHKMIHICIPCFVPICHSRAIYSPPFRGGVGGEVYIIFSVISSLIRPSRSSSFAVRVLLSLAWKAMLCTSFTLVGLPLMPHCAGSPSTSATLHWMRLR